MKQTPNINRDRIIHAIRSHLKPVEFVDAMLIGGSAAFDRLDKYSDVDVHLYIADDFVEQTFAAVVTALESISPIADTWRIPEPSWHGGSQAFYTLENASKYLKIDCAVIAQSNPNKFLERELHGNPIVLFDKTGVTTPTVYDWDKNRAELKQRITRLIDRFPQTQIYVEKEILCGNPLDAIAFYRGMVVNPIVDLLRAIHDPSRYSWGMRYLKWVISAEDHDRLTNLVYITSLHDMAQKIPLAQTWFDELVAQLPEHLHRNNVHAASNIMF